MEEKWCVCVERVNMNQYWMEIGWWFEYDDDDGFWKERYSDPNDVWEICVILLNFFFFICLYVWRESIWINIEWKLGWWFEYDDDDDGVLERKIFGSKRRVRNMCDTFKFFFLYMFVCVERVNMNQYWMGIGWWFEYDDDDGVFGERER